MKRLEQFLINAIGVIPYIVIYITGVVAFWYVLIRLVRYAVMGV